jgi:hypothetical protein
MVFACAAELRAGAKSLPTGAPKAAAASGCSRGRQALRAGWQPPAAAKSRIRTPAAPRRPAQPRRLYLLHRQARGWPAAPGHARDAQARCPRHGSKPH